MRRIGLLAGVSLLAVGISTASAQDLDKLTLQLKWVTQAQFAGYYYALDNGRQKVSASIGRLQLDMVWATIAVAALSGSIFYGCITLLERRLTFWHPSVRT